MMRMMMMMMMMWWWWWWWSWWWWWWSWSWWWWWRWRWWCDDDDDDDAMMIMIMMMMMTMMVMMIMIMIMIMMMMMMTMMMMMLIMMMTVQIKQVVFWNDDDAFSHSGYAKILFRYSGVLIFYSHHGHFYHGRETIVNQVVASVIASQQQRSMTQLSFVVRRQSKGQPFLFSSCDLFGWWHIGHMTAWPWIAH